MTAAAPKDGASNADIKVDDIGSKTLKWTEGYIDHLHTLGDELCRALRRRDGARVLSVYVQYARDMAHISDSAPVGLAEWIRALDEGA
jgi:hypothetical protein